MSTQRKSTSKAATAAASTSSTLTAADRLTSDAYTPIPRSHAHPSTSHTLQLPDVSLHYDLHGDPASPHKVVFIMGLLTDGAAWAYQIDYFVHHGYQCMSFDHRGVGQSSTPGVLAINTYTTRNMARDVLQLVNHVEWEAMHVVGVSMGGMIALELALQLEPTRIQSLSLIVTHAGGWSGLTPWSGVSWMVKSTFIKEPSARLAALMHTLYSDATLNNAPKKKRLYEHHTSRLMHRKEPQLVAILGHTLAVYRHYISFTNLLKLRYAPYPSLVIVGDEDKLVRLSNSHMLAKILGCRLHIVQHGAHGLLAAFPDEINQQLHAVMEEGERGERASPPSDMEDAALADPTQDLSLEAQEALMSSTDSDSASHSGPYSLEEQAIALACSHSVHCSVHNLVGFFTAFLPAFLFRWIWYDSHALTGPHPLSRLEQSVRFGLILGMARGGFRAIRCIVRAYRARAWILKHNLHAHGVDSGTSSKNNRRKVAPRAGIPVGHDVVGAPIHSLLLLALFVVIIWKKNLLAGIAGTE